MKLHNDDRIFFAAWQAMKHDLLTARLGEQVRLNARGDLLRHIMMQHVPSASNHLELHVLECSEA